MPSLAEVESTAITHGVLWDVVEQELVPGVKLYNPAFRKLFHADYRGPHTLEVLRIDRDVLMEITIRGFGPASNGAKMCCALYVWDYLQQVNAIRKRGPEWIAS